MKVIKTKKLVEEIDKFGSDPFDKIPDVVGSATGSMYAQIPYAGADAIAKAKEHSEEIKKMAKKQVDDANKSGALKNTEKDRTEIKKVKSPDLKKMHLSENLGDEKLTEETNYEKVMKVLKNYKKEEALTEAEDDVKNEFDVEDLADKYNPKAIKFEDNGYGLFSVLLEDEDVDFSAWMDVAVKDGDINTDWNQYVFYMTDPRDRFNKAMQENAEVYDKADAAVVNYLLDQGVIIQNEDSTWSVVEKA